MIVVLVQEYFEPYNKERIDEIRKVLLLNIGNPNIDRVYLLNEKTYTWINQIINTTDKLVPIHTGRRLTFENAFKFANANLDPGATVIFCNNDIAFRFNASPNNDILKSHYESDNKLSFDTIEYVLRDNPRTVIALSRWDLKDPNGTLKLFNVPDSQDTWILKTPIKIPASCDFYFGYLGCDNRIAYELDNVGYKLRNIPQDIVTVHHHLSKFRTYQPENKVIGPYKSLYSEQIIRPIITFASEVVVIYKKIWE